MYYGQHTLALAFALSSWLSTAPVRDGVTSCAIFLETSVEGMVYGDLVREFFDNGMNLEIFRYLFERGT